MKSQVKRLRGKLERITSADDLRTGDLLLTVDHDMAESVDLVDCIDNGFIYTVDHEEFGSTKEPLSTFVEDYHRVYRINTGAKR